MINCYDFFRYFSSKSVSDLKSTFELRSDLCVCFRLKTGHIRVQILFVHFVYFRIQLMVLLILQF